MHSTGSGPGHFCICLIQKNLTQELLELKEKLTDQLELISGRSSTNKQHLQRIKKLKEEEKKLRKLLNDMEAEKTRITSSIGIVRVFSVK